MICPTRPIDCPDPTVCHPRCRFCLVPPIGCLHFVGFKDDRYWNAIKTFGLPDFYHRNWDARAKQEIGPDDVAIFAVGDETIAPKSISWDDSQQDIIARGIKGVDW